MVDADRMLNEFLELLKIDSLSRQERQMADRLKSILSGMGILVYEDDAGSKIGGNAGNLITTLEGDKSAPAALLMAHMDTVVPGTGKKPVVKDGIVYSDGSTILGGDDIAGVEVVLETIRVIKEGKVPHGDIQIVFSVAEEGGLHGATNLDYSKIYAKYGFILDSDGDVGTVAVNAPSQNKIDVILKGKAAHAGIEPEKGVNAIQMASRAISNMRLGKVDDETTANIGIINGGQATNIICDRVEIKAEARSRDEKKLHEQTMHMKECFEEAAANYGGSVDFSYSLLYPAFSIKESDTIVAFLKKGALECGLDLKLVATGGGSDTNIVNRKGIQAVDVGIGMQKVHSVEERIAVADMVKAVEFMVSVIRNVR